MQMPEKEIPKKILHIEIEKRKHQEEDPEAKG